MAIERNGDFILIQRNTIRISEIISCKPVLYVQFDHNGREIGRDFPKIIVMTNHGTHQFLYGNEEARDQDLRELQEAISSSSVSNAKDSQEKTTINISGSSGVNIVSNSNNVTINKEAREDASRIIDSLKEELEKATEISQEIREDIFAALGDFQSQINAGESVKRYSFKNLLGLTSDIATLNSFALQLGQVLGYIPK